MRSRGSARSRRRFPKFSWRPATAAPPPSRACATSTSPPRTLPAWWHSPRPRRSGSPSSGPKVRWSLAWSTPSPPPACAASDRARRPRSSKAPRRSRKNSSSATAFPPRPMPLSPAKHSTPTGCESSARPSSSRRAGSPRARAWSSSTRRKKPSRTAQSMFGGQFGSAGDQVVIEEFLPGEEASFIVMADGKNILTMRDFAGSQAAARCRCRP